jgi:hypothetical protein
MAPTTTVTVRTIGTPSEFVALNAGKDGTHENNSEYLGDLLRRDKERAERKAHERLKVELARAFAAPDEDYRLLTAAEVIARNPH